MIAVKLTYAEVQAAALTGVQRHVESLKAGHQNRYAANKDNAWQLDIQGALGEMAVAKALGIFWSHSVNAFKAPDVGTLHVRSSTNADAPLIVRPGDDQAAAFVLVTGSDNVWTVHGWIRASAARRDEWRGNPGGYGEAWFVPQQALTPLTPGNTEVDR